jgi:hypothetical protein
MRHLVSDALGGPRTSRAVQSGERLAVRTAAPLASVAPGAPWRAWRAHAGGRENGRAFGQRRTGRAVARLAGARWRRNHLADRPIPPRRQITAHSISLIPRCRTQPRQPDGESTGLFSSLSRLGG